MNPETPTTPAAPASRGWHRIELEFTDEDYARLERATAAHNARWSERIGAGSDFRPADMALGIILVELVQREMRSVAPTAGSEGA